MCVRGCVCVRVCVRDGKSVVRVCGKGDGKMVRVCESV